MAKIITENFRSGITEDFYNSISNENYYIFASSIDKSNVIINSQVEKRNFLRRVIFGNKVDGTNARYLFTKNNWVEGNIYDAFDDSADVSTLDMYVTVLDGDINEGSYNVYKCLDNNGGSASTSQPTFTTNEETRTSDGYIWKYMFSVPPSEYITYQTTAALPYFEDSSAVSAAIENISDILITSVDPNIFESVVLGSNTAVEGIVQEGAVGNYIVSIITDEEPSSANNTYQNMYIKFDSNENYIFEISRTVKPGDSTNQLDVYFTSSIIFDENEIDEIESDTVSIVPKITVSPSDGSGNNCIAYGIIDSSGNLIDIQFANRGSKYTYATAELALPPALVGEKDCSLRVVVSPKNGHASNPISELYMSKVLVNTSFFSSDFTNIPDSNTYTKIGIVKNPTFRDSTFPSDIDNRMIMTANTDIRTDVIATNSYVYQTKSGGEVVEGIIHEIAYDSNTDITTIYLVDYTGDYSTTFEAGEANVKTEPDSLISNDFTINTITPGNYVPYSGEIYHFVDFNPIERQPDTKEKVKFVFDF